MFDWIFTPELFSEHIYVDGKWYSQEQFKSTFVSICTLCAFIHQKSIYIPMFVYKELQSNNMSELYL